MKRFSLILFLFLFLLLNIFIVGSLAQPKTLRQGVYTIEEISLSPNISYTIRNISPNEYIYLIISDSNQIVHQSIQLEPSSQKYYLQPLRVDYTLSIIGKGEVIIS